MEQAGTIYGLNDTLIGQLRSQGFVIGEAYSSDRKIICRPIADEVGEIHDGRILCYDKDLEAVLGKVIGTIYDLEHSSPGGGWHIEGLNRGLKEEFLTLCETYSEKGKKLTIHKLTGDETFPEDRNKIGEIYNGRVLCFGNLSLDYFLWDYGRLDDEEDQRS